MNHFVGSKVYIKYKSTVYIKYIWRDSGIRLVLDYTWLLYNNHYENSTEKSQGSVSVWNTTKQREESATDEIFLRQDGDRQTHLKCVMLWIHFAEAPLGNTAKK